MKKAKSKKPTGKASAGRQDIKRTEPGQAAAAMKTFMNLERIKGKIVPSEMGSYLSEHDKWENCLDMARFVRDSQRTDEDAAFFFIAFALDNLAEERKEKDAELARINAAIQTKEKEAGLAEDECWPAGEAPEDVEALRSEFDERCRQIDAEVMREHGEAAMADLFLNDEKEFFRRRVRGAILLAKDKGAEEAEGVKATFRQIIVNRGWDDLLPGLDM